MYTHNSPVTGSRPPSNGVKNGWKSIGSTIAILAIAPLLAVFITIFVFQSYEVYGESMETTLQNGDRLIVMKFSKSWAQIQGRDFVPQRGEIIVFDKPTEIFSNGNDVDHLIKRVIGLPGERVVLKDGKYTVYNSDFPDGFDPDADQEYAKDILQTPGDVDVVVGDNEIFVSGDNRNNSLDSRSLGPIDIKNITGVAKLRFVPINSFESF